MGGSHRNLAVPTAEPAQGRKEDGQQGQSSVWILVEGKASRQMGQAHVQGQLCPVLAELGAILPSKDLGLAPKMDLGPKGLRPGQGRAPQGLVRRVPRRMQGGPQQPL